MKNKMAQLLSNKKNSLLMLAAMIGLIAYIGLSLHYAHKILVTMDEGSYLIKGASYLRGESVPYQVDGMITNKTPLSFYIPGLSQVLFGDGIRSGRYFSVFLGALMLLGLWLTVRRVSNLTFAAIAVWMVVLTQNWLVYYARSMTQVISILFLVWSLYFILGEGRKTWELILGGIMAVLLVLTRQNMIPYLFFLYLYLAWQFGIKKAFLTQLPGIFLFLIVHVVFWPGIYIFVWRAAMPGFVTSFLTDNDLLGGYKIIKAVNKIEPKSFTLIQNIQEIFGGLRFSSIPYAMFIMMITLFGFKNPGQDVKRKQIWFVLVNFVVLTAIHIYAAVDNNVFLYSFPAYLTFFAPMLLIGFALAYPYLGDKVGVHRTLFGLALVLVLFSGVGLHIHKSISDPIINSTLPRFSNGWFSDGSVKVWQLVVNKFGIEKPAQGYIFSILGGLALGFAFVLLLFVIWKFIPRISKHPFMFVLLLSLVGFSTILSPTPLFSISEVNNQCDDDAIATFERASLQLSEKIPAGSTVFWDTDKSPSPAMLLYLKDVNLFPSQLNGRFYLKKEENFPDGLPPFAWSKKIALEWLKRSDFVVLNEKTVKDWDAFLSTSQQPVYQQVNHTDLTYSCDHTSYVLIYKKAK
jgi:hypothetical protein